MPEEGLESEGLLFWKVPWALGTHLSWSHSAILTLDREPL